MTNLFCCKCAAKCETVLISGQNREVCPDCGYIYYRNPSPAVSVIIADGKRIILGKRSNTSVYSGKWCLPCGYVEYGESFYDAVLRETKEEVGIDIEPQKIINVVSNELSHNINSLVIVVLSKPLTFDIIAGDDISEVKWFDISQPLPELAFDADKYIIGKFTECLILGTEVSGITLSERKSHFIQK